MDRVEEVMKELRAFVAGRVHDPNPTTRWWIPLRNTEAHHIINASGIAG